MQSSDWQPMETAPLNPYGKPWGPSVLIWDRATGTPITAYFEPWHGWTDRDCGPAWIVDDGTGDQAIAPEDAGGWMPIAVPWGEQASNAMRRGEGVKESLTADREENGRFSGDWTDAMCRAFAYGYDGEDAHQRGESNPWLAGPQHDPEWETERIACVRDGLYALALHPRQDGRKEITAEAGKEICHY